ncbi:hypothetical protein BJ138DRAFT_1101871 [Hygrophoropsis aurantiaca]|uniref:Uncharacterized protein n=1 Tax=Hygrophoropsis aurantiaca TaxID=72124 RepID=A0ACB8AAX5_9AGAM|nr:hypothetical protein BJ138DRAFT_1101871 [Hygrophoropsis aurantiaca]
MCSKIVFQIPRRMILKWRTDSDKLTLPDGLQSWERKFASNSMAHLLMENDENIKIGPSHGRYRIVHGFKLINQSLRMIKQDQAYHSEPLACMRMWDDVGFWERDHVQTFRIHTLIQSAPGSPVAPTGTHYYIIANLQSPAILKRKYGITIYSYVRQSPTLLSVIERSLIPDHFAHAERSKPEYGHGFSVVTMRGRTLNLGRSGGLLNLK